jgi:tetratricopeptide (TPR) repeat protein
MCCNFRELRSIGSKWKRTQPANGSRSRTHCRNFAPAITRGRQAFARTRCGPFPTTPTRCAWRQKPTWPCGSSSCRTPRDRCHAAIPGFAAAHDVYGDLMLATGRAGRAIEAYEKTLRLDPARPVTLAKIDRARQIAAARRRDRRKGREHTWHSSRRFARPNPCSRPAMSNKAEDIYRSILKKDPDHVEAARLLAGIASLNKRFNEAEVFLSAPRHWRRTTRVPGSTSSTRSGNRRNTTRR